jgi:hypothetical protein
VYVNDIKRASSFITTFKDLGFKYTLLVLLKQNIYDTVMSLYVQFFLRRNMLFQFLIICKRFHQLSHVKRQGDWKN